MKLLTQNSKMKKTNKVMNVNVYNFGIAAYKSKDGDSICKNALHCVADCYARQGAYRFSNVKAAFENRYQITLGDRFEDLMCNEISKKRAITHVRIHDSGDFYSLDYLEKWITIMQEYPNIIFYAYTKEISLLKNNKEHLPSNFKYIFSYGGKQDYLIDKDKDRHAIVYNNIDDIPSNYVDASSNDLLALSSDNPRIGLSYHGNKKSTGFNKLEVA